MLWVSGTVGEVSIPESSSNLEAETRAPGDTEDVKFYHLERT